MTKYVVNLMAELHSYIYDFMQTMASLTVNHKY
jgi:hypothetical protein